jgi:hypothetical protein
MEGIIFLYLALGSPSRDSSVVTLCEDDIRLFPKISIFFGLNSAVVLSGKENNFSSEFFFVTSSVNLTKYSSLFLHCFK